MKIYTQVIDIALQSPKRFWVAPYSDFKIGVKIVKKGTPVANEFTVKQGSTTLTADETTVDGFTTYTLKSGATGSVEYVVEVAGVAEKQKITQIVTDSTVFDVGGEGGSGGVTEQWVQDYVSAETSAFVTDTELGTVLEAYPTTSVMESAISTATSDKVTGAGYGQAPAILSATSVYASAWATLSSTANENTMYVVLPDPPHPPPPEDSSVFVLTNNTTDTRLIEGSLDYNAISDIAEEIKVANIGNAVSAIADYTFVYKNNLTDITLPGSVKSLGESSFESSENLSSVTIAEGLETIGVMAFSSTSNLKEFVIPSSVTTIGVNALRGSRTSVTFMGKTLAQVQAMTNYPWGITDTSVIHAELS